MVYLPPYLPPFLPSLPHRVVVSRPGAPQVYAWLLPSISVYGGSPFSLHCLLPHLSSPAPSLPPPSLPPSLPPWCPQVYACLPKVPWSITPADMAGRADFTSWRIFSIDPMTARSAADCDLVSALSLLLWELLRDWQAADRLEGPTRHALGNVAIVFTPICSTIRQLDGSAT